MEYGWTNQKGAFNAINPSMASNAKNRGKPCENGLVKDWKERRKNPIEPIRKTINSSIQVYVSFSGRIPGLDGSPDRNISPGILPLAQ